MANICENTLHFYTTSRENIEYTKEWFNKYYSLSADVEIVDDNQVDIYFDSKWDFPETLMNQFVEGMPDKDDVDIEVLSVEWGCHYCAFHTSDGGNFNLEN